MSDFECELIAPTPRRGEEALGSVAAAVLLFVAGPWKTPRGRNARWKMDDGRWKLEWEI